MLIAELDTSIFAIQPGHYSDRTSFLRIQRQVRGKLPGYAYLEVGPNMGGSLLPHCSTWPAASMVDSRSESQPDEGGSDFHYTGNSAVRILAEPAKHVSAEELGKLVSMDTVSQTLIVR